MKKVGCCCYIHKTAMDQLSEYQRELVNRTLSYLPADFDYTIIKVNNKTGEVSFTLSSDWDEVNEPTVGDSIVISTDGSQRISEMFHLKKFKLLMSFAIPSLT